MRYAISLNLDYAGHPQEQLKALFRLLREGLLQAGFRQDGRLFTIELPEAEACRLAKQVIERVSERGGFGEVYGYVKELYGFNFESAVNILLPSPDIGVVEFGENEQVEYIDLLPPRTSD